MNQQVSLERMVAGWMADEAALSAGLAEHLSDQITAATGRQRPRPRWLALIQESPMRAQTQVVVGSPTRRLSLVAVLLFMAALAAVAVGAALLVQPKPVADEWPGFRGDASHVGLGVSGPIGNPVVAWTYAASGGVRNNISVAQDLVIVPSDEGVLQALGVDDGRSRWTFTAPGPMGGPFAVGDRTYVGDGAGFVHALTTADGNEVWATPTPLTGPTSPTKLGDRLFVGTTDGLVVAIDAASGSEVWRAEVSPGLPTHAPAAGNGMVIAATEDGRLVAIEPDSGAIRWDVPVSSDPVGTPVIVDGLAFLGASADSELGRLAAIDITDGQEVWQVGDSLFAPSVSDGIAYTGGAGGLVTANDLGTGVERWRVTLDGVVRAPAVAGSVVYVAADAQRQVVALDRATGGELWTFDVDSANECCIAVSHGMVFVGTAAGTVYAIGGDGALLTAKAPPSVTPASSPTPSPTISPDPTPPPLDTDLLWAANSGADNFVPWGLAQAPDGLLWATEGLSDRFSLFTTDGEFVESWGTAGQGDGELDLTRGNGDPFGMIAFAPDGSFYVLDVGNYRVQHFDADREFVNAWGEFGSGPGQFSDPTSMALDADGNVHVLDGVRLVIESYDANGRLLGSIPAIPDEIGPNGGPHQVTVGPNGNFFVGVVTPNHVIELDRDGNLVATYGSAVAGVSPFNEQPIVIAFDAVGRMYVTQGPQRGDRPGVVVFGTDGSYLGGFGPVGAGPSDLGFPWGLVIAEDGIYVSDAGGVPDLGLSSLIRRFTPITFP